MNPATLCPHFDFCNQNDCPLDSNSESLKSFDSDKGHKTCKLTKRKRMEIALQHNLQNKGLYGRESAESKFCKAILKKWQADHSKLPENKDGVNSPNKKTKDGASSPIKEGGSGQEQPK